MPKLDNPRLVIIGRHGDKILVPCGDHGCGVAMHEGLVRDMKIPEHLVTVSAYG